MIQILWILTRSSKKNIICRSLYSQILLYAFLDYLFEFCCTINVFQHNISSTNQGKVKAQYKVGGLKNSRKTFVIDPSGKIVHVTGSIFNWKKHVEEALSYCK